MGRTTRGSMKILGTNLNSILAYETVKTVRIHDWRVGGLYWGLMFCIFLYIVGYEMLYEEGYRAMAVAQGFTRQGLDLNFNTSTARYCLRSNEQPGATLPDGTMRFPCVFLDDMEMVFARGPGFMTVTTYMNRTDQTRECSP